MHASSILLTGGSGRLGQELQRLMPGIIAPSRQQLDITNLTSVRAAIAQHQPDILIHAAAYTDVAGAETNQKACWQSNVQGTRHMVQAALEFGCTLVFISTDYVFAGTTGGYKEEDALGPVRNYYALTKLVAESIVRVVPAHLVIRTSFRPRKWAYPSAFADVFTSQDYVDVIAPDIALAVKHLDEISFDTLHVATERKSVLELARRRSPLVKAGSKRDVAVALPDDISLDVSRWQTLKQQFLGEA